MTRSRRRGHERGGGHGRPSGCGHRRRSGAPSPMTSQRRTPRLAPGRCSSISSRRRTAAASLSMDPPLSPEERTAAAQDLFNHFFRLGPLQPLLDDESIEEVVVNAPDRGSWSGPEVPRRSSTRASPPMRKSGPACPDHLAIRKADRRRVARRRRAPSRRGRACTRCFRRSRDGHASRSVATGWWPRASTT